MSEFLSFCHHCIYIRSYRRMVLGYVGKAALALGAILLALILFFCL